jgi:hypothetical protein
VRIRYGIYTGREGYPAQFFFLSLSVLFILALRRVSSSPTLGSHELDQQRPLWSVYRSSRNLAFWLYAYSFFSILLVQTYYSDKRRQHKYQTHGRTRVATRE